MPNHKNVATVYGCTHYERRCAYISPCCKKIYACRVCHDNNENHEINRHAVTEIICVVCDTKQPVARSCINCSIVFGQYFCEICRLFDDKDKKQFHCEQCGICRVDGRENFFHCSKCDMCLSVSLKESHKCVEKVTHANCSVCLEDLHTSREGLSVLNCGHITHQKCLRSLLKSGHYACPLCCHSMVDMANTWSHLDNEIAHCEMPEEYRNRLIVVLCRDCHKSSRTSFHVLGLKCKKCGSYNTCHAASSDTIDSDEDEEIVSSHDEQNAVHTSNDNHNENHHNNNGHHL